MESHVSACRRYIWSRAEDSFYRTKGQTFTRLPLPSSTAHVHSLAYPKKKKSRARGTLMLPLRPAAQTLLVMGDTETCRECMCIQKKAPTTASSGTNFYHPKLFGTAESSHILARRLTRGSPVCVALYTCSCRGSCMHSRGAFVDFG